MASACAMFQPHVTRTDLDDVECDGIVFARAKVHVFLEVHAQKFEHEIELLLDVYDVQ